MRRAGAAILALGLLLVLAGGGCATGRGGAEGSAGVQQRAMAAALRAAAAAEKARGCRELALRAVENALAVEREASIGLLAALRDGSARSVAAARDAFDESSRASSEAVEMAVGVLEAVGQTETHAIAAAESSRLSDEGVALRDVFKATDRAETLASAAEKALATASRGVARMKERWLLPDAAKTPPLTPSPVPSAPVPRGPVALSGE